LRTIADKRSSKTAPKPGAGIKIGRIQLGLVNVWVLISSACFWAWFDTATFRPTLFMPFTGSQRFYGLYFIVTITSGAVALLIAALFKERITTLITLKPYGLIAVLIAVCSTLATMLGASLLNPVIILVSAVLTGTACSFFLLEWARIYSRQGAKSAGLLISSSIAAGVLIDTLVIGLSPLFAALFTILLPVIVVGFLLNVYDTIDPRTPEEQASVPQISTNNDTDAAATNHGSLTLESIFSASHYRVFGLSLSLVASFFIFGFSFGFMQFNSAFMSTELYPFSSDALLISRGITALLVFFAMYFWPKRVYAVFRIGILIGIAGFILVPFLDLVADNGLVTGFLIAVGYTTFDIITWTLLAELSFATRQSTLTTFGSGRFVVHIAIAVGFVVALLLVANPQTMALREGFSNTVGYLLVIAEVLLLSENSALWMLIRTNAVKSAPTNAAADASGTIPAQESQSLVQAIQAHGLTVREAEILRFLLIGRSALRIAQSLCISENTVNSHIKHIYGKFAVHSRQELLDFFA
jgi:DNA-binding CsgD family transcriptional regulator